MAKKLIFTSFRSFAERFNTDEACREYLGKVLWNGKPKCPHCGCRKIYTYTKRPVFKCSDCLKQFRVTTNTIFEDSKIPLTVWFDAIYYMACFPKTISSVQLAKMLHITQKSAWYMAQNIRLAMANKKNQKMLSGIVEVDETYVGGRKKGGKRGRGTEKAKIFGMLERGGEIRLMKVDSVDKDTLQMLIFDNVDIGYTIMSDEWKAYQGLNEIYDHYVINHGKRHYADGIVHVNTLEAAWGLMKRIFKGIYHSPSKEHMDAYTGEFMFRYNSRKKTMQVRFRDFVSQTKIRTKHADIKRKKRTL